MFRIICNTGDANQTNHSNALSIVAEEVASNCKQLASMSSLAAFDPVDITD